MNTSNQFLTTRDADQKHQLHLYVNLYDWQKKLEHVREWDNNKVRCRITRHEWKFINSGVTLPLTFKNVISESTHQSDNQPLDQ